MWEKRRNGYKILAVKSLQSSPQGSEEEAEGKY
jgi:hypothetical protein